MRVRDDAGVRGSGPIPEESIVHKAFCRAYCLVERVCQADDRHRAELGIQENLPAVWAQAARRPTKIDSPPGFTPEGCKP